MTSTETTAGPNIAGVAAEGAQAAPEKATSKKAASKKKGAPKAKGGAKEAKLDRARKPVRATAKKEAKSSGKKATSQKAKTVATTARKPREGTAKATVLELIKRQSGATLDEIVKTTGWQKHTVRAFLSTEPKKAGLVVTSTRRESDKARVYQAKGRI